MHSELLQSSGLMEPADNYNDYTFEQARPYLKGRVLEVGCGVGSLTTRIAPLVDKLVAIDSDPRALSYSQLKLSGRQKNIQFERADILSFESIDKFDAIICLNVLEHIRDDEKALAKMAALLADGGVLILLVPAGKFMFSVADREAGHWRRYAKKDLVKKIQTYFQLENIYYFNFIGALGYYFIHKILGKKTVESTGNIYFFDRYLVKFTKAIDHWQLPFGLSLIAIAKKQNNLMQQKKQTEWHWQWDSLYDSSLFLFKEWLDPYTLEDFKDKLVLDAGCGGGQHVNFVAPFAKKVVGLDLNSVDVAARNNSRHHNVEFIEGDAASFSYREKFDIIYSLGVIHHTDDPRKTFLNLYENLKSGGKFIIHVYSHEDNFLNRVVLESIKRHFFLRLPKSALMVFSYLLTVLLYPIIYTIYLLPFKKLPYWEYFKNWRKLSFYRNNLNVFDKLNAPQTNFITRQQVEEWFSDSRFDDVHIRHYNKVVWCASGTKK